MQGTLALVSIVEKQIPCLRLLLPVAVKDRQDISKRVVVSGIVGGEPGVSKGDLLPQSKGRDLLR